MRYGSFIVVLTRRLAQLVTMVIALVHGALLLPFLAIGLLLQPGTFQRSFYASQEGSGSLQRRFPFLHFLFWGAWRLKDPHPAFSQVAMLRDFPRLLLQPPVINHLLNPNAEVDFPLTGLSAPIRGKESAVALLSPLRNAPYDEFQRLFREDAQEISREASSITPTPAVENALHVNHIHAVRDATVAAAIGRLLQRFPDEIDMLLVVSWLGIRGGSEKVSERYIAYLRTRYPADRICIFVPDMIHAHSTGTESYYGIKIIAINEELPQVDQEMRIAVYDRVMIERRPAVVHNINSLTAWQAHQRYGRFYKDTRLFLNLYSDIRMRDGSPVGYYHNYLPYMLEEAHGVICDNTTVKQKFIVENGLIEKDAAKFHVVPTPIVGLNNGDPRENLRLWKQTQTRRSLWMSRIAPEKRLDIVKAISEEVPSRSIAVFGAILPVSYPTDMSWKARPNIDHRGEFESFRDLPLDEFDSYIFTSDGEGMPLAVLEVTMLGLPIIAPNVGGIGEFIDDQTGWLVSGPDAVGEYAAALRQIEAEPDEAARRVRNAQQRLVERHSWPNFIRTLEAIPGYIHLEEK